MTKTRYLLRDVGTLLPEGALLSFVRHLPPDSALMRELDPDMAWLTGEKVPLLLASICDQLSWLQYTIVKANGGKPTKPRPIPRPGVKDNAQTVGSAPIPISEFDEWYYGGD